MLLAILLISILTIYCFNTAFYAKPNRIDDIHDVPNTDQYKPYYNEMISLIDKLNQEPFEAVSTVSVDGLTLRGRLYMRDENAPIEIAFNGYRTTGVHDAGGIFQLARKAGHNILIVDQRATGKSDGTVISFGIKERFDVLSWVNYINQRFGTKMKIILIGGSLGGATVLMASNLDLPSNVVAIIADSAYTSPKEIIIKVIKSMYLPANFIYTFVKFAAKLLGHFNLEEATASDSVMHTNKPILFIHGGSDHYVPCEMAKENFQKCNSKNKQLLIIPDAPHDISLLTDWNTYQNTVFNFYKQLGIMVK